MPSKFVEGFRNRTHAHENIEIRFNIRNEISLYMAALRSAQVNNFSQ